MSAEFFLMALATLRKLFFKVVLLRLVAGCAANRG